MLHISLDLPREGIVLFSNVRQSGIGQLDAFCYVLMCHYFLLTEPK
jgi:hypothetical protein